MRSDRKVLGCIPPDAVEAVLACVFYCVCSNAMVLSNKAVLTYYHFNYPLSLMAFQAGCTALVMDVSRRVGIIKCEPFQFHVAKKVLPLNLLFVAMICTSSYATQYLSVPLLTVFKNLTNIAITFGEQHFFGKSVSLGVIVSIAIMVGGSIFAGVNDVQFSPQGYFWLFLNCIASAGYVLFMKWSLDETKLSKDGMVLHNNMLGLPIVLALVLINERDVIEFDDYANIGFRCVLLLSGAVGFFMSLSSFYAMQKTSPTTYSMIGALNKIPASILGAIFFSAVITPGGWVGIGIGLLGGVVFALVKAMENRSPAATAVTRVIDDEDVEENELLTVHDRQGK